MTPPVKLNSKDDATPESDASPYPTNNPGDNNVFAVIVDAKESKIISPGGSKVIDPCVTGNPNFISIPPESNPSLLSNPILPKVASVFLA